MKRFIPFMIIFFTPALFATNPYLVEEQQDTVFDKNDGEVIENGSRAPSGFPQQPQDIESQEDIEFENQESWEEADLQEQQTWDPEFDAIDDEYTEDEGANSP
jgi:hypothetical protein